MFVADMSVALARYQACSSVIHSLLVLGISSCVSLLQLHYRDSLLVAKRSDSSLLARGPVTAIFTARSRAATDLVRPFPVSHVVSFMLCWNEFDRIGIAFSAHA